MTEPLNPEVAVLNAALELPAERRAAYLDEACAGDEALRRQVEALLRAHEQAEDFLEAPPTGLHYNRTALLNTPLTEKAGDKIGRYKLLQQIASWPTNGSASSGECGNNAGLMTKPRSAQPAETRSENLRRLDATISVNKKWKIH